MGSSRRRDGRRAARFDGRRGHRPGRRLRAIATKPGQVKGIISWCRQINSPRIIPFASVHPKDYHADKWVARIAKRKLGGIKLHPMYQDFRVDDEAVFPIYRAAIDNGLPVALHTGWDIGFEDDPVPDRASPERVARVLDQLPELRLLCTHLGGWRLWQEARHFLAGRDVWWETSFCLPYMTEADFVRQIKAHRPDRVCFGTDWPWRRQDADVRRVSRLGFDPKFLDALLYGNAAEFLGM